MGFTDVRVAPLIVDTRPFHETAPDPFMTTWLDDHVDGPVLLSVAQVLPHKRPDLLVKAMHTASTSFRNVTSTGASPEAAAAAPKPRQVSSGWSAGPPGPPYQRPTKSTCWPAAGWTRSTWSRR